MIAGVHETSLKRVVDAVADGAVEVEVDGIEEVEEGMGVG